MAAFLPVSSSPLPAPAPRGPPGGSSPPKGAARAAHRPAGRGGRGGGRRGAPAPGGGARPPPSSAPPGFACTSSRATGRAPRWSAGRSRTNFACGYGVFCRTDDRISTRRRQGSWRSSSGRDGGRRCASSTRCGALTARRREGDVLPPAAAVEAVVAVAQAHFALHPADAAHVHGGVHLHFAPDQAAPDVGPVELGAHRSPVVDELEAVVRALLVHDRGGDIRTAGTRHQLALPGEVEPLGNPAAPVDVLSIARPAVPLHHIGG